MYCIRGIYNAMFWLVHYKIPEFRECFIIGECGKSSTVDIIKMPSLRERQIFTKQRPNLKEISTIILTSLPVIKKIL